MDRKSSKFDKKKIAVAGIALAAIVAAGIIFTAVKNTGDTTDPSEEPSVTETSESSEDPANAVEDYAETTGLYVNSGAVSGTDRAGGTLTVGAETDDSNGIVINPQYVNPNHPRVGYYIKGTINGILSYSQTEYLSEDMVAAANNVIIDNSYDQLKSVVYNDQDDYGLAWSIQIDDPALQTDPIKLVAVDLDSHNIIASYTVEIGRTDDNMFAITNVYDNDISSMSVDHATALWNSNIDEEEEEEAKKEAAETGIDYIEPTRLDSIDLVSFRQQLIDAAMAQIDSDDFITVREPFDLSTATVELTSTTYHDHYLTVEHMIGYSGRLNYPVWAVTINSTLPELGHFTFYFSKENPSLCYGVDYIRRNTYTELSESMRIEP